MEDLTLLHSFAGGDAITILPGLQDLYNRTGIKSKIYQKIDFGAEYYSGAAHSTYGTDGTPVTMNKAHFDMLKPLIEAQPYISGFLEWNGEEVKINIDNTRDSRSIPIPATPLPLWLFFIAPELYCDISVSWLNVPCGTSSAWDIKNKILINRTERYNNPYIHFYFLKPFEKDIVFMGTTKEYTLFREKWGLNIEYLPVKDFLEAAKYIQECRFFIGGQSLFFHISEALKVPRLLEICGQFPNTFPFGKDGYSFVNQKSFELLFNKLYKKH